MAIDIHNETVLSLTEATKVLPRLNGKRPSISTLWRWCRKGLRGVRLEYIRLGRSIATSEEALNRFFEALAEADEVPVENRPAASARPQRANPSRRQASLDAADKVLERAGI